MWTGEIKPDSDKQFRLIVVVRGIEQVTKLEADQSVWEECGFKL